MLRDSPFILVGIGGVAVVVLSFPRPAAGGPTVTIAGTPFQTSLCESGSFNAATPPPCGFPDNYTVPAGRQLVIEYVSGSCLVGPIAGTSLGVRLITTVGGTQAQHVFPLSVGLGEADFAQRTQIYADPGSTVYFYFTQYGFAGAAPASAVCNGALSGYTLP